MPSCYTPSMAHLRSAWTVLIAALLLAAPALAQQRPLEITNVASDAAFVNNRLSRAYPAIEYNVRIAAVGGVFPYVYTLGTAPSGMTINPATGEIVWPAPRASTTAAVTVRDSVGAEVTASWRIEVTTERFKFIDAVKGRPASGNDCERDCGTGTVENPWRSILDLQRSRHAPGEFVYFRTGTYRVADVPRSQRGSVDTPWERVEFDERARPVVWLSYPGERPVIDFAASRADEPRPLLRLSGDNVYVDGFDTVNSHLIAFQTFAHRYRAGTFRRLRMRKHGPSQEGANASYIMTMSAPTPPRALVIQDCDFAESAAVMLKLYSQQTALIEDNVFHDAEAGVELKADMRQFTVRGNTFERITNIAIGGNMHATTTNGEILFNNVRSAGMALDVNQDGMAGPIRIHRNTLVGRVQVRSTDAADGPFTFTDNVIVNETGSRERSSLTMRDVAEGRVVLKNNLTGRPGDRIVDATGQLTPGHAPEIGQRGHQRR
jgi:hypothetical protein